jgi:DNA modification methylase
MLVCGDARQIPLPDDSVQCIITSPPYWGLRKYSGDQDLIWQSQPDCAHEWQGERHETKSNWETFVKTDGSAMKSAEQLAQTSGFTHSTCARCGAWRGGYGLEPVVEMYIAHSLEILRECRRVLRKDGVLFWNLGDSYMGSGHGWCVNPNGKQLTQAYCRETNTAARACPVNYISSPNDAGMKPKDLALIPERIALAAQADGWYVRARIIWAKLNPMPESVRDRPTKSHETIWMFTKSARYYWDKYAVLEPKAESTLADRRGNEDGQRRDYDYPGAPSNGGTNLGGGEGNRNMRDVWDFPTQPYSGAHFATFPEELPLRCILAATSAYGACAACGAPYARRVKIQPSTMNVRVRDAARGAADASEGYADTQEEIAKYGPEMLGNVETTGWRKSCKCATDDVMPCLVLDPFGGSGTTGRVAVENRRRAVLLDLAYTRASATDRAKGRQYEKLAQERTRGVQIKMLR